MERTEASPYQLSIWLMHTAGLDAERSVQKAEELKTQIEQVADKLLPTDAAGHASLIALLSCDVIPKTT